MSVQLMDPLLPQPGILSELTEGGIDGNALGGAVGNPLALGGLDNISSQYPQQSPLGNLLNDMNPLQSPASLMFGPLGGIGQFLMQMLSRLFGNGGGNNGNDEEYFNNANGGSVGDPHLSFNGSTWNNMGSQPDLLNSDSFHGGYQLSTQTTPPNAQGVTYNQSATVSTNFGNTQVSLDNAGNATITQDGYSYPLQSGTCIDLGHGETVTRNQDGSLAIACTNRRGGEITTTMRDNGQGVDVTTSANNVDLGGALVNGAQNPGANATLEPMGRPQYRRYAI
ncbi:MAG TPA: hypothetical protein VNF68_04300 [Candidatus Baltobacteraceae bacterium]|nr:hypothetical protein [Candidatus Baltobacteraceae bacterium]